eukprot:scaffold10196_cov129-Isochrysis_galbana.AAC.5
MSTTPSLASARPQDEEPGISAQGTSKAFAGNGRGWGRLFERPARIGSRVGRKRNKCDFPPLNSVWVIDILPSPSI